MAKRVADKQMTKDNWEEEEETVEPGTFTKASEECLQTRKIKRAKRRSATNTGNSSSPFAAFSGLTSKATTLPTFNFLSKTPSVNGAKDNLKQSGSSTSDCTAKLSISSSKVTKQEGNASRDLEYFRLLKNLNESILDWIQRHLEKTPYCDFTPAFKDYEKYMQDLEKKFPHREDGEKKEDTPGDMSELVVKGNSSSTANMQPTTSTNSIIAQPATAESHSVATAKTTASASLTFGSKSSTSGLLFGTAPLAASPAGFTFGLNSTNSSLNESDPNKTPAQPSGFAFSLSSTGQTSGAKTFSFASAASTKPKEEAEEEEHTEGDEENYEPPKETFVPIEEEGSVYSKRCKLFYKKKDSFVERGVGMLHIKPLDGKTQLLIRADNSVGTVLLNISLVSSIPINRTGKNNVLVVCVPNPPMDSAGDGPESKALPLLIRVKTTEDADELLQKLNEHKC